ncbi:PREDICTED: uncharacterized protein LOC107162677 [Diuraphis noxia]|uniref:uncharacterized protein LOC107162677 n=1 Tax=Diuraphis noxia TaxID=143948 RepID=UPI00076379F6|nr:PREDICTED: uncharacterized protein LOC107162677 [Diuraphis noxia]
MGKPKTTVLNANHPNSRKTKQLIKSKHNLEVPNILEASQLLYLRTWDGDIKYLPNFKIIRFRCLN